MALDKLEAIRAFCRIVGVVRRLVQGGAAAENERGGNERRDERKAEHGARNFAP